MIYADRTAGIIVTGATGKQGAFHIALMNEYARSVGGTGVVAGVTPGKGGQEIHGVPVYNTVREALCSHDASVGVIFVPGSAAGDSVMEVSAAGIPLAVVITEHIPVHDTMKAIAFARLEGCDVIGPNCPGLLSPGEIKLGIMPAHLFTRGSVGVISRSGTLTYEIVDELTRAGLGQSSVIGIGGDPGMIKRPGPSSSSARSGGLLKKKEQPRPISPSLRISPASRHLPRKGWGMQARS
jgi:succinyl-CoA synthetase alpha subunit